MIGVKAREDKKTFKRLRRLLRIVKGLIQIL